MAQYIKQGNLFGRIGSGIGKGLATQLPEEIQRGRLAAGLKELGSQKDLTPFQQFSSLASLPGITPQMLQSGSDLLRQQAYLNSIRNQYEGQQPGGVKPNQYMPSQEELNAPVKGEIPSLSTPEGTSQSYKTFIPPTEQEERRDAYDNFNKNPARYGYNFDNALNERKAITQRNQEIQKAYQEQEKTSVGKEEKVKTSFDKEAQRLGIIPMGENPNFDPKLYQKLEEKLLNSVLSKEDGGEGLTQEQATKKYSDQLTKAYENYRNINTLSPWSPIEFNRRLDTIQKNLSSLGVDGKKTLMDKLIADYQLSPIYAAHKAFPINKSEIPSLKKLGLKIGAPTAFGFDMPKINYSQLKKEMGKENSPLSIAYELSELGYRPEGWLKYLDNNRDDLETWQSNQLSANINLIDLKDFWLKAWE